MDRRGRVSLLGALLVLAIAAVVYGVWLFGPYYWDYLKMKQIAKTAVLDWHAFDSERHARSRYMTELKARHIPDYIDPEACSFEEESGLRIVECDYSVDVYYPFTDYYKTLHFHVYTDIDQSGELSQD